MTHTESLQELAKVQGFDDWQKLQYFLKEADDFVSGLDFTDSQWGFLIQTQNGVAGHTKTYSDQKLIHSVIQQSIYEPFGYFEDEDEIKVSTYNEETEEYTPSSNVAEILDKLMGFSPREMLMVFCACRAFWKNIMFIKEGDEHIYMTMNNRV